MCGEDVAGGIGVGSCMVLECSDVEAEGGWWTDVVRDEVAVG